LVKPASVDSIPTSASQEDHVSMGGYASRKCHNILDNVRNMMGIELMMACQAIDIIEAKGSSKIMHLHQKIRQQIPFIENDVYLGQYIEIAGKYMADGLGNLLL
jgi:histidine ammonia-lyase